MNCRWGDHDSINRLLPVPVIPALSPALSLMPLLLPILTALLQLTDRLHLASKFLFIQIIMQTHFYLSLLPYLSHNLIAKLKEKGKGKE